jgi:hypothetical protein
LIILPDSGRKNLPEASALARQTQTAKMTNTLLASMLSNFFFSSSLTLRTNKLERFVSR